MAEQRSGKNAGRMFPAKYEKIIAMDDDKINVLVLGASGCGKSTLINAFLGYEAALTGYGGGVTKKIEVYQNDELPFRLIDTAGYEYDIFHRAKIKREIARFCRAGVKNSDIEKLVHMIWFCIDGTSKRIDQSVLSFIRMVADDWKNVPVMVVFTKSYSVVEIDENIAMAKAAIEQYNTAHKRKPLHIIDILPVVAKTYQIDDAISVSPFGLDHLASKTMEYAPKAREISRESVKEIDLKIKNNTAMSIAGAAAAAAALVGAVPIPIADAAVLVPVQMGMLKAISRVYGIKDQEASKEIIDTVLKVGGTTIAGKTLLSMLKAVPGLNAAGIVLNAAVAGSVTFTAGEISNLMFQRAYTGKAVLDDPDWEKAVTQMFRDYLPGLMKALSALSTANGGKLDVNTIRQFFADLKAGKKG